MIFLTCAIKDGFGTPQIKNFIAVLVYEDMLDMNNDDLWNDIELLCPLCMHYHNYNLSTGNRTTY